MTEEWLVQLAQSFPDACDANCRLTSPVDMNYNCVAWAAHDTDRWWWPDPLEQAYWPVGAARAESVEAFIQAFSSLGYFDVADVTLEPQREKIAIFVDGRGKPTHAARQLRNGWWTSKLGNQVDISHHLPALEGGIYGKVAVVLSRIKHSDG